MFQVQDQSLRPLATAHLAQTMTLLALPNVELQDKVMNELAANPALELIDERVCPHCDRRLLPGRRCPACSTQNGDTEAIVFLSPRESFRPSSGRRSDDSLPETDPAAPEDLPTYVLQQLAADLNPRNRALAAYILCSLDEDGFLLEAPAMIARATRSAWADVTKVIDLISRADPPGLATTGPHQALLVQLDLLEEKSPITGLARKILEEAFSELGRREHEHLAKRFGVSLNRVRQAVTYIQENLNPYPARSFWGSGTQRPAPDANVYHIPDIQISMANQNGDEGPLMVEIFSSYPGWLRVNPLFRQAMGQTEDTNSEDWNRQLERASLFVKCIQQRNNTMRRLMKVLVHKQRPFILQGAQQLVPMTRAQIATEMDVHESTISRAVSHKSVALPNGRIIPLSRFFDRSLPIRDRIREIIEHETKPLTDEAMVDLLRKEGIRVARRTVAKYRAQEGILPARLRHRSKSAVVHGV